MRFLETKVRRFSFFADALLLIYWSFVWSIQNCETDECSTASASKPLRVSQKSAILSTIRVDISTMLFFFSSPWLKLLSVILNYNNVCIYLEYIRSICYSFNIFHLTLVVALNIYTISNNCLASLLYLCWFFQAHTVAF